MKPLEFVLMFLILKEVLHIDNLKKLMKVSIRLEKYEKDFK
jgi:hypothetical protein